MTEYLLGSVILVLLLGLFLQQWLWMKYSQDLADKLKSSNFWEYTQGKKELSNLPGRPKENLVALELPEDKGPSKADELNRIMGL